MNLLILLILVSHAFVGEGCQMEDVNWFVPVSLQIKDVDSGVIFNRSTSNIIGYNLVSQGEGLLGGPYFTVSLVDSVFSVATNEAFTNYENYETAQSVLIQIMFTCQGNALPEFFAMTINIEDTNNNDPIFQPSSDYQFTVLPPLAPGVLITDCINRIIVRDIDLTTQRIDFEIEDNPFIEVSYDETGDSEVKTFAAVLRTTSFIRSLPEPLQLTISATDVDETGDPPRSSQATITITANTAFELPTEPIFEHPNYFANYSETHTITLEQRISLRQGYDNQVHFRLTGDYLENFGIQREGSEVYLDVINPLPYENISGDHIILVVNAEREYTSGATTTVIVRLPEETPLLFEQAYYEGSIEDNMLSLQPLILQQGYEGRIITVEITGEHNSFFTAVPNGNSITILLAFALDDNIVESNNIITLQIEASNGISSSTTIVNFNVIKEDTVTPVFEQTLYIGSYTVEGGLILEAITLSQGYDSTVNRTLTGDHREFFSLNEDGPSVRLVQNAPLTPEILAESNIVLYLEATKPRTVGATSAVSIAIEQITLQFAQNFYIGKLENNLIEITPISMLQSPPQGTAINILGDFEAYFNIVYEDATIVIELNQDLPPEVLENAFIVFEIEASSPTAVSSTATVIVEIVKEARSPVAPEFEQPYYVGEYSEQNGLNFQHTIRLSEGFDETVSFTPSSDHLQWFNVNPIGNEISLEVPANIPPDVLENHENFILVITAENSDQYKATATIIINIVKESSETIVLGFEQANYVGTLEDSGLVLDSITLVHGNSESVQYTLHGDMSEYFTATPQGNSVIITIQESIPEDTLLTNRFIVLELRANAPQAISASATIVLRVVQDTEIIVLNLNEVYYSGNYNAEQESLTLEQDIYITEGNDDTVVYGLVGADAQWFELAVGLNNVRRLTLPSPLPAEVLQNTNMLVFVVTATKPGATTARSTIAISLSESPETTVLGFEQANYVGTLEDSGLVLDSITLVHGNSESVQYTLHGDMSEYFTATPQGNSVIITIQESIPEDTLLTNRFIVLELRANAPQAISASATIVLRVVQDTEIIVLNLNEVYYSGNYNAEQESLTLEQDIYITEGNDDTVVYGLVGADAQWFELAVETNNVRRLTLPSPLPAEVLQNTNMLVFVVTATKPGATTARSTIAISLSESPETTVLGFEQANYVGTLEDSGLVLDSITLVHGNSESVQYTLHGDMSEYFTATPQGNSVIITIQESIPEETLLTNRFIVLELRANAPQAISASATIVLRVVQDTEIIVLNLNEVYYSGNYNAEQESLTLEQDIYITEGNDDTVVYGLVGADAQWFELAVGTNNVRRLTLPSPLPAEVLQNTNMLVFVVTATKPGATTARSTIAISLSESPETTVLGFEQANYVGTLEDSGLVLDSITLVHGNSESVQYTLHGDMSEYFTATPQGNSVIITIQESIPEDTLLTNRFIVLELRANAPQVISASATIVLRVVQDTEIIVLNLNEVYYSGNYNAEQESLTLEQDIYITEGNDDTVVYGLVGADAQWFELAVETNNVRRLTLPSPLPAEVLQNTNMLVFVVTATKPGATTARSTIAISLSESPETTVLGFEQANYVGTLEDSGLVLDSITLVHGNSESVQYTLHGDMSEYFTATPQGNSVIITIQESIPEETLLTNRFIVLELRANAPQAISASATIVLRVVQDTEIIVLNLNEVYYSGNYNAEQESLTLEQDIYITEGNDGTVVYGLVGADAQWFELAVGTNNVRRLTLPSPLPAEVLQNTNMLVFVVTATKPGATTARSTIAISLSESPETTVLGFEQANYVGTLEDSGLVLDSITLVHGNSESVQYTLHGDMSEYFTATPQGNSVIITIQESIPEETLLTNRFIVLELRANAPQAISASATIVLRVVQDTEIIVLNLNEVYYSGNYNAEQESLTLEQDIYITEGNDDTVVYGLVGADAQWFELAVGTNNVRRLTLPSPLPAEVLQNTNMLVFVVTATKPGATTARSTIAISLSESPETTVLGFEQANYVGTLEDSGLVLDSITLVHGNSESVQYTLHGDMSEYFTATPQGNSVIITIQESIPEETRLTNRFIVLELRANAPQAISASATIVLRVLQDTEIIVLNLNEVYYSGNYNAEQESLTLEQDIYITEGNDDTVVYGLVGADAQWFELAVGTNNVRRLTLPSPLPAEVLQNANMLVFVVTATKPGATTARSTIAISLSGSYAEVVHVIFGQLHYIGEYSNEQLIFEDIISLSEGYDETVQFHLQEDGSEYFELITLEPNQMTLHLKGPLPASILINPKNFIAFDIIASKPGFRDAQSTIIVVLPVHEYVQADHLVFSETRYIGAYSANHLIFNEVMYLIEGYDETVEFVLNGEGSEYFKLESSEINRVTLHLPQPLPENVTQFRYFIAFDIKASRPGFRDAKATIFIHIFDDTTELTAAFEKVLFRGQIQAGEVTHEPITITDFDGDSVQLIGEYSNLFEAPIVNGLVDIRATAPLTIPATLAFVSLEMQAEAANAVLILVVDHGTEPPVIPLVAFASPSYAFNVDVSTSGLIGKIDATADNGEAVRYNLVIDNVHLLERLFVNNEGEILLSAPANSGVYSFQAVATTIFTGATATTSGYLTVEIITLIDCEDERYVVPPLIVLERDEESEHRNLVSSTTFEDCHFILHNQWPLDQDWLYVDDSGLHARQIDREDPRIAFMALSQVQIELILQCEGDPNRAKRSVTTLNNGLGPYEYGQYTWLLTNSISYNSKRSFVNLVINDINDNPPIFIGHENQPLVVGYPVSELENTILPRSLAELQATDADIGVNAALSYWTTDDAIAVSPSTGFVHVRNMDLLEDGLQLTVHATDQNGQGNNTLTGSITLTVKLLNASHIAVVTVRNTFLENEAEVLTTLSTSLGYEVKLLRSLIIAQDHDDDSDLITRKRTKRDTDSGTSMQLFVYGIDNREPVEVIQLIADVQNNEISADVIIFTLEDHLNDIESCVIMNGNDTGLLAATIVLSVLLFILVVAIAVWFFLKWKKNKVYEQFSDENSLASSIDLVGEFPKTELPTKPRLNIEELKRSERRLQGMLDAPLEAVAVEPSKSSKKEDTLVNIPTETGLPIVIQSIDKLKTSEGSDDEDEFGEVQIPRRKSVVTFNENVEKIIHVQDTPDLDGDPEFEVYKF